MSAWTIAREAATARVLLIDIERLPGLAPVWDQKPRFLPISKWRRLPAIVCFAAQWYGTRTIEFQSCWGDGYQPMIERSRELYNQADLVVTFNGRAFDNQHLRGAWLVLGLPPPRPWRDVDLYLVAKQFGYESKGLAHLCRMLGVPGKLGHYDADEAEAAVDGDERMQRRLQRYNQGDVRALKRVYDRTRPYISNHPPLGLYNGKPRACHACGSTDLVPEGYDATPLTLYGALRCQRCGAPVRNTHVKARAETRGAR